MIMPIIYRRSVMIYVSLQAEYGWTNIGSGVSMHSIISADAVIGILGHPITLRCPAVSTSSNASLSNKAWFRGTVPNSGATMARLVTKGFDVEFNHSYHHEKMWISSLDGDLTIRNLKPEDTGFYTCHFAGVESHTIHLSVTGVFIWFISRW